METTDWSGIFPPFRLPGRANTIPPTHPRADMERDTKAVGKLAWISTAPNSPHKKLARMLIFRVFSPQSCYANRCADSLIFRRLLAHRLLDSGHFGALRGEKTLRTGAYQNTNLPNGRGTFPESCESLGAWDVRLNLCHGNPG